MAANTNVHRIMVAKPSLWIFMRGSRSGKITENRLRSQQIKDEYGVLKKLSLNGQHGANVKRRH